MATFASSSSSSSSGYAENSMAIIASSSSSSQSPPPSNNNFKKDYCSICLEPLHSDDSVLDSRLYKEYWMKFQNKGPILVRLSVLKEEPDTYYSFSLVWIFSQHLSHSTELMLEL
ncbi:hypothetical protein L484_000434 [Morus notabilis]|uniref:Uncharacterized protein n=1 Tax=Morus notabilis TaxID=981085 RepID=W9QXI8_9ROSA|nr:hypothetical protein L484_000434 [Morus notabilis]